MAAHGPRSLHRHLKSAASVAGIVVLSVLTTLLVQHLLVPSPAEAQFIQVPEIRAQSFVLTGSDGTVIGHLGAGSQGAGNLTLFDAGGQLHMAVSGAGDLLAYGTGGTALAQIYADPQTNLSGMLIRDADGKLRIVAAQGPDSAAVRVQDPDGKQRVGMGTLANPSGGSSEDYGLRVRDADGNILATFPQP